MENIYEVASANKRKTAIIVALFLVFTTLTFYILIRAYAAFTGYAPGGLGYFGIAFIVSGITSFIGYYASDKIVLTISGARPADRSKEFDFYTVAENLSIGAGIPKPKLYIIEDSAPNAFATGRNPENAVICATTGLLDKLDRTELEGVIGHELTHIKSYDTRLMTATSVLVGSVALLGDWFLRSSVRTKRDRKSGQLDAIFVAIGLVFALLSPIIAQLIQLAISRRREFNADAGSVEITRQPGGLISALRKIENDKEPLEVANKATAHLYIADPFKNKVRSGVSWFANLFNTHPPLEERIKALQKMI